MSMLILVLSVSAFAIYLCLILFFVIGSYLESSHNDDKGDKHDESDN